MFVYYAGHGCMSNKQFFVLNEEKLEKRFWPAEERLRLIGVKSGSKVKIIVVNDCCREDYMELRKSMESQQEREDHLCIHCKFPDSCSVEQSLSWGLPQWFEK